MKKKKVHTEIEQTLANTRLTDITVAQKLENIKYGWAHPVHIKKTKTKTKTDLCCFHLLMACVCNALSVGLWCDSELVDMRFMTGMHS